MPKPEMQGIHRYRDYLEWDDGRYELIDGVVYDMAPAPSRKHQELSMELSGHIWNHLGQKSSCKVYTAPFDVRIPEADESDDMVTTVVQPDIAVICDPSKLDERGCRGAPDWVIEIVSPSTASQDYIRKLALYEKHGVREYWIVHPTDKIVTIYRRNEKGEYGRPGIYSVENRVESSVVEGFALDLQDVF